MTNESNAIESPAPVAAPVKMSMSELTAAVAALTARVEALESPVAGSSPAAKEMTDADAESVTYGDLAEKKHKDAAAELGLTYGQIYSCRKEFTFKAVHAAARKESKANRFTA